MIPKHTIDRIRHLTQHRVVVGLSGGIDSMVLLDLALAEFGDAVHALHVNHGLQPEANAWEAHCRDACSALGAGFTAIRVAVAGQGNVEAAAREARYAAFEDFLGSGDVLLLAHHRDDQVETILQTLFRGTGRFGVSGMPAERPLGAAHLLRPLLVLSRRDIERHATEAGLAWIVDDSNADERMNRNWLRHSLLPAVETRWPQARDALLAAADRDEGYRQVIDFAADTDLSAIRDGSGLALSALATLAPARRLNALRYWIESFGLPVPAETALTEGLEALLAARDDGAPLFAWQGVCLRRFAGRLFLTSPVPDENSKVQEDVVPGARDFGIGRIEIANEKNEGVLRAQDCRLVTRRPAMAILLRHHRPLKKVFQEAGVPPWLRPHLPIVTCGDEVVAVAAMPDWGIPMNVADGWRPGPGEIGARIAFFVPNQPYSD